MLRSLIHAQRLANVLQLITPHQAIDRRSIQPFQHCIITDFNAELTWSLRLLIWEIPVHEIVISVQEVRFLRIPTDSRGGCLGIRGGRVGEW